MKMILLLSLLTFSVQSGSLAQLVSLRLDNASVERAFQSIRKQTGYRFVYKESTLKKTSPVSLHVTDEPLASALHKLLKDQPVVYQIYDGTVVVKEKEIEPVPKLVLSSDDLAIKAPQQIQISGKVTDNTGKPLAGVSVIAKGSQEGTSTREDGSYKLSVPDKTQLLTFSMIGYKTLEVSIQGRTTVNVTLEAVPSGMDEVIVVAYGTVKKGDFTGSANQITAEDLQNRPILNPLDALQASGPGIQTTSSQGAPGSSPAIRIRGFGSIDASTSPLIVVDGMAYDGGLTNINTDDIESITTLKDAATVALWGSRASNGVIMITTKSGMRNRNTLSIKATQGFSQRGIPEYDRVNAFEYYPLMWESLRNSLLYPTSGTGLPMDVASIEASYGVLNELGYNPFKDIASSDIVRPDGTLNPYAVLLYPDDLDWTKDIVRLGDRKDYALSYTGGNEKSDFLGSLGYTDEKGYLKTTRMRRFSGRLKVNTQPQKWIKTGLNIAGSINHSDNAFTGSSTEFQNPFYFSRVIGPIYPVHAHNMTTGEYLLDENGHKIYDEGNMKGLGLGLPNRPPGANVGRHAIEEAFLNSNGYDRNAISARSFGTIIFTDWLKFTTNIGIDLTDYMGLTYYNAKIGNGAPAGSSSKLSYKERSYTFNQLVDFNKKFGEHNITATIGHENYDYLYSTVSGERKNEILQGSLEFPNFSTISDVSSGKSEYRIESYFGRVTYNYAGKYYVSGNYREDGNSRFSPHVRWKGFYGFGVAWRIDREDFMRPLTWINSLKIRSSYGQLGNDGIGTFYAYQARYTLGYNNGNDPGALQTQLPNPGLTWETSKPFDIGIDFTLFRNRLGGSIEYYDRQTTGLIFDVNLPLSDGGFSIPTNIGNMYNRGVEVQLYGDIVRTRDFNWHMSVNATTIKNQITKMPDQNPEIINGTKKLAVGRSIYDYWIRGWYGVDSADGDALFWAADPDGAGVRLIDNGHGFDTVTTNINNARYHYAGTAIPNVYGGIENRLRYKRLTLSFLLQYQLGGLTYDATYAQLMHSGSYGAALHKDILNRWQKPGDLTDVPRMQNSKVNVFGATSDRWLTSSSFLYVRNINLSYALPDRWLQRINATSAALMASVENVYLFSSRKGTNINQNFNGTNSNVYTPSRIFTVGVNVNF